MDAELHDVIGDRGEKLVEVRLMKYAPIGRPLFRTALLGAKWPATDVLVELAAGVDAGPYFFGQVKATTLDLTNRSIRVKVEKKSVKRLLAIPCPTYVFGVHDETERIFVRAVHAGTPERAISTIPLRFELTPDKLQLLHEEVVAFWSGNSVKPSESVFT